MNLPYYEAGIFFIACAGGGFLPNTF